VVGSQVPAGWQVSVAHAMGLPPEHVPAWQVDPCTQRLLVLHVAPLGRGEQVPARPGRLQALHCWSVQAELQQTPFTQKPLVHWLFDVHETPWDPS
jgi:hypothetical protein